VSAPGGTSGISGGGSFTNQPDYLVKTTGTTTIQSVSFLSVSGTTLRVAGTTHTDFLRVDDAAVFNNLQTPAGANRVDLVYTNSGNPNNVLGEPDIWLQINYSGTNYLFPGYASPG
jgi:SH3-like domain-containing protein